MSEGLLTGLVIAAALACPAHMWWMHRRGKRAACCPPGPAPSNGAGLRARQSEIEAQLAALDGGREVRAQRQRP